MKLSGQPGEFASKALIKNVFSGDWNLTKGYFFTYEEALENYRRLTVLSEEEFRKNVKWPVEVYDQSLIYIPNESELI